MEEDFKNLKLHEQENILNYKAFENKKAFIPFITAGYPNADASVEYILAAADAGADLIEVGIPFSDPTAEGPVIQKADMVALQNGMTVKGAFEVVERVRKVKPDLPIAFMTYINPVFKFRGDAPEGVETEPYVPFFERCKADGIDALILADLPFEEQEEVLSVSDKYGVDLISMVSPTSEDRIRRIAKSPRGFIYVVSSQYGPSHPRDESVREMRGRLRHLDAGAGGEDGLHLRRRHRRLRNPPSDCRRRDEGGRLQLRKVYEGRG